MADEFKDFQDTAPTLSFGDDAVKEDPKADEKKDLLAQIADIQTDIKKEETNLSPKEIEQVDSFVEQIDLTNSNAILNYGAGTQKKIADFSQRALDNVRTKDMGATGEMITKLVTDLKNFDVDENEKGIKAFFKKKANKMEIMRAKYAKIETNVNDISNQLEEKQVQLMKDTALLDKMYQMNENYYKELTMYILAGKKKLEEVRSVDLPKLQAAAQASGLPEDAQKAKDLASQCERFEKKIYDLELTRTVSMQTAPQIRMVQASDTVMAEKIQSSIVNTIPLWKNQMVIALGVEHSVQAAKAQREVSEMTNELLRKNADSLKTATVETMKESERGIVDIETLQHTNETLISTLDEVLQIQQDGREKRKAAEQELSQIEDQLKSKLLEVSKNSQEYADR